VLYSIYVFHNNSNNTIVYGHFAHRREDPTHGCKFYSFELSLIEVSKITYNSEFTCAYLDDMCECGSGALTMLMWISICGSGAFIPDNFFRVKASDPHTLASRPLHSNDTHWRGNAQPQTVQHVDASDRPNLLWRSL